MKPSDFTPAAPGRVLKAPENYFAFVPNPLPPKFKWTGELVFAVSEADMALGRLAGVGQTLVNPHLLIGPFMKREAVLSSKIEGTEASLSDLFVFEAAPNTRPKAPDVAEVVNYVTALQYGLDRHKTMPISLRLLRELHELLLGGVSGPHLTPGEFRRTQNWIGRPGCTLNEATYVPPPPHQMLEALGAFEAYLHAPSNLPPLVRLALIHYQFEAIHPFLDGNGRIGRLLITLLLCVNGILPQPLLYLSAYFERNRSDYYSHLQSVSQGGHWNEWITFFLHGVRDQALDAIERANRLLELRDVYRDRCQVARSSALQLKLVDQLFDRPVTTAMNAAEHLDVSFHSAQKSIDKLVEFGILVEATGQRRHRIYVANEIMRSIEGSTGSNVVRPRKPKIGNLESTQHR